jgi:hypothetical protein
MPSTPFNGPSSSGNPYLVITVDGKATTWAKYNFAGDDCTLLPNKTCKGSLQIDPAPYSEPGVYFDMNNNPIGMQSNPFAQPCGGCAWCK